MNIIIVDDERYALLDLESIVKEVNPQSFTYSFQSGNEALTFLNEKEIQVAFLDIEMRGSDGLTIAKRMKDIQPDINIIFVTGHAKYAMDSYSVLASDYILKPATPAMVKKALQSLRNPIKNKEGAICIQTFGNFEIFVNNEPVHFKRKKAKEVLAYLVDRKGATSSISEIASVIYEEKPYDRSIQKQMQVYISELISSLKEVSADHIIFRRRNSISIKIAEVTCDYYDFLAGKSYAVNAYRGEYMSNYSWANLKIEK